LFVELQPAVIIITVVQKEKNEKYDTIVYDTSIRQPKAPNSGYSGMARPLNGMNRSWLVSAFGVLPECM
jgi:hypothetical protein